jgi:hypothetical protein
MWYDPSLLWIEPEDHNEDDPGADNTEAVRTQGCEGAAMPVVQDTGGPEYGIDPQDIELGRRLLAKRDSNAWQLARLALHAVPDYEPGKHDNGALAWFAEQIGWTDRGKTVATLAEYRSAAANWSRREVARWPGLSVGAARRLNRFPPAERERILSACASANPRGRVTTAAVKEAVEGAPPVSSGSTQRNQGKLIEPTPQVIAQMMREFQEMASLLKTMFDALKQAPIDFASLDNASDLFDGIWDEAFKVIKKLDTDPEFVNPPSPLHPE